MIAQISKQTNVSSWLRQHRVLVYFILTLAISWSIELPLVASAQGWIAAPLPFAIHYLASLGPLLAALIMTWAIGGSDGLRELWGRITKWRVGSIGVIFAFLSPVALFVLAAVVVWALSGGEWPNLQQLTEINYLPNLGIGALILWLATFGFGEEIGWRGYALPRLQRGPQCLVCHFDTGGDVGGVARARFLLPGYLRESGPCRFSDVCIRRAGRRDCADVALQHHRRQRVDGGRLARRV